MRSKIVTLHASGAETASGESENVSTIDAKDLGVAIDVTDVSGTAPTVDFSLEWSPDGVNFGDAETPDTFAQINATKVTAKRFDVKAAVYRLKWVLGGIVQEIQRILSDYTGGTFTITFDGEGPTSAIPWDAPILSVAAEATLTLDVLPIDGIAAEGTLTLDTALTDGDQMTVDSKVYTFQASLTDVDGNVAIGSSLAESKENLVAAFDLSGEAGTDYATAMTAHPTVDIAAFVGDAAVLTAKTKGTAGDLIVTTETFFEGTNIFDDTTLGATTAGRANDTYTIGSKIYTFEETLTNTDGNVAIGGSLGQAQLNLVAALDLSGTAGTDYAVAMTAHATVDIAAFAGDAAVLTAKTAGDAGNSIVTTETFFAGTNIFDGTTLGTTTSGVYGVETELELLASIDTVEVTRGGDGDWSVTFEAGTGDVPMMTVDDTLLTAGTSIVVSETTQGAATSIEFLVTAAAHL